MPLNAQEKWSTKMLTEDADGWTAVREFTVTGTPASDLANEVTVLAQAGIPIVNTVHPQNSNLKVKTRTVDPGLRMRTVKIAYAYPPKGTWEQNINPLNQPAEVFPQISSYTQQFDRDATVAKNPIVNSNRDAFSSPPNREVLCLTVQFRKYRAIFELPLALSMSNRVNLGSFVLPGVGTIADGQGWCRAVTVAQPYTTASIYVQVITTIEIREAGWDVEILDQGMRTRKTGLVPVHIVDANGEKIASEIPLDGTGRPKLAGYWAGSVGTAPAAVSAPAGATLIPLTDATYLKYQRYEKGSFAPLNPLIT